MPFDKTAYQREYMRLKRACEKAGYVGYDKETMKALVDTGKVKLDVTQKQHHTLPVRTVPKIVDASPANKHHIATHTTKTSIPSHKLQVTAIPSDYSPEIEQQIYEEFQQALKWKSNLMGGINLSKKEQLEVFNEVLAKFQQQPIRKQPPSPYHNMRMHTMSSKYQQQPQPQPQPTEKKTSKLLRTILDVAYDTLTALSQSSTHDKN